MQQSQVTFNGLSKLECLELKKIVGEREIFINDKIRTEEEHGELSTAVATVIVSIATLKAISVWLSRRRSTRDFTMTLTKSDADGSSKSLELHVHTSESELPPKETIEQLKVFFESTWLRE